MYDRILVPTDGSEGSKSALEHAERLAKTYSAEIHVLYVADVRADVNETVSAMMVQNLEEAGEKIIEDFTESIDSDLETSSNVNLGIPHTEISNYVEENDIDLVVMGTHGRSGLRRLLLGSVTEKVLRTADVAVLTAPVEED